MMEQGFILLVHLLVFCVDQQCTVQQTTLAEFTHPQLCDVADAQMEELFPNDTFYCTKEREI